MVGWLFDCCRLFGCTAVLMVYFGFAVLGLNVVFRNRVV